MRSISPRGERKLAVRNFRPVRRKCILEACSPSLPRRRCSGWSSRANPVLMRDQRFISKQFRLRRLEPNKAAAMNGTRTVLRQSGEVSCRAVAFVPGETVSGKSAVIFEHQPVAGDLGENARRSDGKTARVAFDQSALRKTQRLHPQTVHQHVLRLRPQLRERLIHRAVGGLQNVDGVYGLGVDSSDSELDGAAGGQPLKKSFTPGSRQLLGVIDSGESSGKAGAYPFRGKRHGRGDDRSGQRSATRLIHAGDALQTASQQRALKRELVVCPL